eukprot:TRINITY_DN10845_c0_g2_i2.p1 TRINITY_DN10845_c0_g2~~TRINITY_DN10845_c0_g2_i2.p1  ORF type:complete len:635 (+),score=27.31 TRINITY_DN10845_c0_g2_i2:70-1974(+)
MPAGSTTAAAAAPPVAANGKEQLQRISREVGAARHRAEAAAQRLAAAPPPQAERRPPNPAPIQRRQAPAPCGARLTLPRRFSGTRFASASPRDSVTVLEPPEMPLPEEDCTELRIPPRGRGRGGGVAAGAAQRRAAPHCSHAGPSVYRETKASRLRKQSAGSFRGGGSAVDRSFSAAAAEPETRQQLGGRRVQQTHTAQHPLPVPRGQHRDAHSRTASYSAPAAAVRRGGALVPPRQTRRPQRPPPTQYHGAAGGARARTASHSAPAADRRPPPTAVSRSASHSVPWVARRSPQQQRGASRSPLRASSTLRSSTTTHGQPHRRRFPGDPAPPLRHAIGPRRHGPGQQAAGVRDSVTTVTTRPPPQASFGTAPRATSPAFPGQRGPSPPRSPPPQPSQGAHTFPAPAPPQPQPRHPRSEPPAAAAPASPVGGAQKFSPPRRQAVRHPRPSSSPPRERAAAAAAAAAGALAIAVSSRSAADPAPRRAAQVVSSPPTVAVGELRSASSGPQRTQPSESAGSSGGSAITLLAQARAARRSARPDIVTPSVDEAYRALREEQQRQWALAEAARSAAQQQPPAGGQPPGRTVQRDMAEFRGERRARHAQLSDREEEGSVSASGAQLRSASAPQRPATVIG